MLQAWSKTTAESFRKNVFLLYYESFGTNKMRYIETFLQNDMLILIAINKTPDDKVQSTRQQKCEALFLLKMSRTCDTRENRLERFSRFHLEVLHTWQRFNTPEDSYYKYA